MTPRKSCVSATKFDLCILWYYQHLMWLLIGPDFEQNAFANQPKVSNNSYWFSHKPQNTIYHN